MEDGYVTLETSRAKDQEDLRLDHIQTQTTATTMAPSSQPPMSNDSDYRVVPLPQPLPQQPPFAADSFCTNVVITSKYTTWNFLPLFMIESFKKLANAYFLLVSVLQCIPDISNTGGLPTNLPVLMFILAVDAVLAIVEDRRRHIADNEANSAQCHIITSTYTRSTPPSSMKQTNESEVSDIQWSELTVGTIVKLRNRETAPADLLILSVAEPDPSSPNGICYVETKSLDGETNLKLRQACDNTVQAISIAQVTGLHGYLRCEQPNRVIARFDGTLTVGNGSPGKEDIEQAPVSIKNVILRGCQLRNTEWMYGLVINTGPDTKIMQSAAKPSPKWSSINETVNKMIIWLFTLLCILCAIATTTQVIWIKNTEFDADYLDWDPALVTQWFLGFGYYFLLMYQMIPVSLYVTISMVMFIQAIFMTWDLDMYYEDLDVRMIVRSMGLNEELGQISYVFSDKTGTLTCNVMEFRKCSINGISYGTGTTEIGRAALRRKGVAVAEDPSPQGSEKQKRIPFVNFEDPRLTNALEKTDRPGAEAEFFLHLSLCHTVIPEAVEGSSEVRLSASSPDEQALVSGAKYFGFSFESRGLGLARVRINNKSMINNMKADSELVEYKVLDVLEFTSDRKRMSVIAQYPNGEYWLLTKGADNMIYPLLSKTKNHPDLLRETMSHLETFGDDGLRTLTIARRRLDAQEYTSWSQRFKTANASLEEIEKRKHGQPNEIDALMSEIEQDLILLGATAIEDKLQKHVPSAIANLMRANVKVWMLTGDKQETAINISYACQLMDNDMKQIVLNMDLFPTKEKLYAHLVEANQDNGSVKSRKAVVIDGECLEVTLLDENCRQLFLELAMSCEAVVCCRVSPSQKAEVVSLVRSANKKARTLAIGDGANDVAMIQRAHVGVGICGQEGMQAVNSSDYAIGQFYFLEKLLLHHGRLNYKRMSILVGYMFYKNIVMVLSQYFYMFFTGSSGQKFYSELGFQLYNVAYTSLPIIVLGVFDYDVPWSVGQKFPELYRVGPRMELFNNRTFVKWIASAVYESFVISFFVLYGFNENLSDSGSAPMVQYGLITFTLVVIICNLKLGLLQMSWSIYACVFWFLGVLAYVPLSVLVSSYWIGLFPTDYGSFQNTLMQETYWLVIPVCCFTALFRHFSWTAIQRRFYPEPWQIVQEQYVLSKSGKPSPLGDLESGNEEHAYFSAGEEANSRLSRMPSERKKRVSSGFAFSYDPQTTVAESYMASHSVSSISSAMSEAESRKRISREDSRASDFSEGSGRGQPSSSGRGQPSSGRGQSSHVDTMSTSIGAGRASTNSTGLFV
ncbi:hypothetical protein Poli38472_007185 [Pythium oligandrum]|uniref:Phospholipid-transporting ATPase n=1 Tax=Pythium oligandrum TaxID=41045 RepID=A0A8K1FD42_PYTOL|nr:hypothetical protein Poli38472_007185 [Pythium oligandrum]|eukprot:TMW59040.1 hypothetical protein Poli38472_007185 [Pythium oligandrum]